MTVSIHIHNSAINQLKAFDDGHRKQIIDFLRNELSSKNRARDIGYTASCDTKSYFLWIYQVGPFYLDFALERENSRRAILMRIRYRGWRQWVSTGECKAIGGFSPYRKIDED